MEIQQENKLSAESINLIDNYFRIYVFSASGVVTHVHRIPLDINQNLDNISELVRDYIKDKFQFLEDIRVSDFSDGSNIPKIQISFENPYIYHHLQIKENLNLAHKYFAEMKAKGFICKHSDGSFRHLATGRMIVYKETLYYDMKCLISFLNVYQNIEVVCKNNRIYLMYKE